MPNAVIYARYSSHAQRDASIDQQLSVCRAFAQRGGIDVVDVYTDRALTGTNDNRPGFRRMLADAAKGGWNYVIVYALDRFSRDRYDAATSKHKLKQAGVKLLSATEPIAETPAGILMESMLEGYAEYYSRELAAKVRRGQMDNAKKCMVNGSLPLGYCKGPDGRYAVEPTEAAVVQEIFRRVGAGEPLANIIDDLNDRGLRSKKGQPWNKSSFNRMLSNERYTGIYIYQDIRIPGGIPAIITQTEFDAVQRAAISKKKPRRAVMPDAPMSRRRQDGVYLLTGKLFCGDCGSPLIGVSGTARNQSLHHYYACKGRISKTSPGCGLKNIRREDIEYEIAAAIKQTMLTPETIQAIAQATYDYQCEAYANPDLTLLEDQLQETNRALKNLMSAIKQTMLTPETIQAIAQATYDYQCEAYANPDLTLLEDQLQETNRALKNLMSAIEQGLFTPTTRDRLLELELQKDNLNARLAVAKSRAADLPTREEIVAALDYYANGDLSDPLYQEALIDTFLVRAYVHSDHYDIYFSPDAKTKTEFPIGFTDATKPIFALLNGSYSLPEVPPTNVIRTSPTEVVCIAGLYRFTVNRPSR